MRSLGVNLGLGLYKEILDLYNDMHYLLPNGTTSTETVVTITTDLLCKKGLQNTPEVQCVDGVWIYPKEYFCPKNYDTGAIKITDNTYSIHHYDATWLPWYVRAEHSFCAKFWVEMLPINMRNHRNGCL